MIRLQRLWRGRERWNFYEDNQGTAVKFELEILIHKPHAEVWAFFHDHEKAKLWQPSLESVDVINGQEGQAGAISRWTYKENGREFSLTETILIREDPDRFESRFENEFASNLVNNIFAAQTENETLWKVETKYRFKTLLMKVLGPILKKNYVARAQKEMERFKDAVEG